MHRWYLFVRHCVIGYPHESVPVPRFSVARVVTGFVLFQVFLYEGAVHLLPLNFPDETSDGLPVTMAAVDAVRDAGAATRAGDELQSCIQHKIDG